MVVVVGVVLLPIPLLNSDSFIKNANISPLHSIVVFNVYPLAKRTSISFSIFLRLVPSFTLGSALLTIINGLSCQFVTFHLALASLSTVGITWLVIPPLFDFKCVSTGTIILFIWHRKSPWCIVHRGHFQYGYSSQITSQIFITFLHKLYKHKSYNQRSSLEQYEGL